ncbi:MAG TPA: sugar phosphate isomerase/epimerase family protein [Planctomycetaceae bacterium]|nr:sugar phosphate isomerase/epimerase family protein [Planctomycetaceae bacterium]
MNKEHRQAATNRRGFLQQTLLGTGTLLALQGARPGAARAADPPERPGPPHMKLSLAAYSFNSVLPKSWTPDQLSQARMTLEDFIHYCAELNLDGTELTAYYFPKVVTHEYLMRLKELAFRLGLDISGTAIGNDFCLPDGPERQQQLELCREWIDHSAVLGAPVIRIFAGKVPRGDTDEAAVERCIAGINESLDYAAKRGVFLALENHGGITATPEQMLRIIRGVKASPWFGVNFDGGNFRTDDPYRDLAEIAPYAVNAQIKATVTRDGKKEPADLRRVVQILKDAGYRGYIALEYEESDDPKQAIPRYIEELRELVRG